jgi:hypothetical protein
MPWLQLTLSTDRERAPLLEAALENAGALAVTLADAGDEPQLEPPLGTTPLWGEVLVTALFEPDPASRQTAETLTTILADLQTGPPRWEETSRPRALGIDSGSVPAASAPRMSPRGPSWSNWTRAWPSVPAITRPRPSACAGWMVSPWSGPG